jgi:hypothetical protein
MSLINDALRQASQAHKQQPDSPLPPTHFVHPPPIPAEAPPAPLSPWPSLIKLVGIGLLVLALLGTGGFFALKAWLNHRSQATATAKAQGLPVKAAAQTAAAPAKPAASTNPAQPVPPAPATAVASVPAAGTPAAAPAKSAPASPTETQVARAPAAPPPPPVKWPPLRLQGIFFRPPDSSVVINNKTLYVDDEVQGVKVAQIERTGVTLVLDGHTNTLFLR